MRITEYRVIQDENLHPILDVVGIHNWKGKDFLYERNIIDMFNSIFKLNVANEEYCYVLALSASLEFKGVYQVSHGSHNKSETGLRELFTFILLSGAEQFYVAHNHPGGSLKPSDDDKGITLQMQMCAGLLHVDFQEHYVVSRKGYGRIKEETMLKV